MNTKFIQIFCVVYFMTFSLGSKGHAPDSTSTIPEWLHYIYEPLDTCDNIGTGILLDKGMMDSFFFFFQGTANDSLGNKDAWYEMFNSLQLAGLDSLTPLDTIYRKAGEYIDQGFIPILGMDFSYNYLNPIALDSGWVDTLDGQYLPVAGKNPFLNADLVSFASTLNVAYGDTLKLIFPDELYFTNRFDELIGLEVRISGGEWQEQSFNSPLLLIDPEFAGPSQILDFDVKVIYEGFFKVSKLRIRRIVRGWRGTYTIEAAYAFDAEIGTNILTADNAIVGLEPAKGYAAISFGKDENGNKHTCITKPLIIVEGIDFGTRENWTGCRNGKCGFLGWEDIVTGANSEMPELANGPKLVKDLTDKGYDLIYLDFYDGATYMENNAMVVVKLIQHLNTYKCSNEELVVCGVSMGGPLTKYALSYMETNDMEHCVRTYVSFDGPHQGANIVIGLQQFIHYAWDKKRDAEATWTYEGKLLRPATKQLLKYHIQGVNYGPHPDRAAFLLNQTSVGNYPKQTRNVAIINGSATVQNMGFNGGDRLMDWHGHWGLLNVDADIFALCGDAFDRTCYVNLPFNNRKTYLAPAVCSDLDRAPGGLRRDIKDFSGKQPIGWATCHFDNQCFIPSISSLDVNTGNYFFNIASGIFPSNKPNPSIYPFEAYYSPFDNNNEPHVFLSYDDIYPNDPERSNIAWLVNEVESTRVGLTSSSLATTYNFGESNKNRLQGLTLASNGVIHINGNYATGNGTGPIPSAGSDFTVVQRGCDKLVKVQSGGLIRIGDNNTPSNNTGTLIFPKASTLELESGSTLRVHNNSTLIIEEGATLIFHSGAQILLDGPEAVIEIRGKLQILSGDFTFSQSSGFTGGYIRFNMSDPSAGIISMGTSATFDLTGSSTPTSMDKVLEIIGGKLTTPNQSQSLLNYLSEFIITNGMVAIGEGSELELSVSGTFSNSYFIGLSDAGTTGLKVLDANLLTLSNCSFRDLTTGLFINLNATTSNPSFSYLTFQNNGVGLETENGALDIHNCAFTNNATAWWANTMSRNANVYQSSFISNGNGILFGNSTPKLLYLEEIDFSLNGNGVYAEDDMEIVAECCLFKLNTNRGIISEGVLNLSTNQITSGKSGGNCAFNNNEIAIEIYGELYLDDGGNVFVNTGAYSSNTFFTGLLPACNPCSFMNTSWQIYSVDNYWNPGYQSSLQVSTSPNPTSAGFIGTSHSSFTSNCFTENISGNPDFTAGWTAPQYKTDHTQGVKDSLFEKVVNYSVFPNPANNGLHIDGFENHERVEIGIFDTKGSCIIKMELSGKERYEISTATLSDGMYTIRIQCEAGIEVQKFIIQHH